MARSTTPTKNGRTPARGSSSSRAKKPEPAPKRYVGDAETPPVIVRAWLGLAHATGALFRAFGPETLEIDKASGTATMTVVLSAFAVVRRILAEIPGARVLGPAEVVDAITAWTRDALGRYRERSA